MVTGPDFFRELKRGEEDQVRALLLDAFARPNEADLVEQLRKSRAIAGEMVLPADGRIVGYAALSTMVSPKGWLCLAPVAIHPEFQGRRNGKRMVGMITSWAQATGQTLVVQGHRDFFARCGFGPIADGFTSPYPLEETMIAGPAKAKVTNLTYPKAFGT
ncbi:GNAT family N-acetyltransferase [Celeribacter arenosi]|uniref:N-acetyltransferase domain-containing protein n=1 Tax=Celeribacter arenosi TaxID=792649 RepID=A0ABP7K2S7_9RHOB